MALNLYKRLTKLLCIIEKSPKSEYLKNPIIFIAYKVYSS